MPKCCLAAAHADGCFNRSAHPFSYAFEALRREHPAPRVVAWKARASKVFAARAFGRQQALAWLLDEQAAYVLSQSGHAPAVSSQQGTVH